MQYVAKIAYPWMSNNWVPERRFYAYKVYTKDFPQFKVLNKKFIS